MTEKQRKRRFRQLNNPMSNYSMFQSIPATKPDAILGLNEAFQADPSPNKVNLTLGVYVNDEGQTPILDCVKAAERQIWEEENTKIYLNIAGMSEFGRCVESLVFGQPAVVSADRVKSLQTPGGTCALRVVADFIAQQFPSSTTWMSVPTWANHANIFSAAGVKISTYPYFRPTALAADIEHMLSTLSAAKAGDFVLLHGCCHNPTGLDPDRNAWQEIAEHLRAHQLIPLVDFAYQGFGRSLDEDAEGVRLLAEQLDELIICCSFSKTFGLYRERVGALTIVGPDSSSANLAFAAMKQCVRRNYSNPPAHGGAIVASVLGNPETQLTWKKELAAMTHNIRLKRQMFVSAIRESACPLDVAGLVEHKGMFSLLPLSPEQTDQLRENHAVYLVRDGRINLAGLRHSNLGYVVESLTAVTA